MTECPKNCHCVKTTKYIFDTISKIELDKGATAILEHITSPMKYALIRAYEKDPACLQGSPEAIAFLYLVEPEGKHADEDGLCP
jgi:hypothetical protein